MIKLKYLLASLIIVGFNMNSTIAGAQQYNGAVSNPFSFCSAPKPCKQCQPMRSYWEQLCPNQKNKNQNEDPDPVLVTTPFNNSSNMTQDEIKAEINRLTPLWNAQTALSGPARDVLEECIKRNGSVQNGNCPAELADYNAKRLPAIAYRDEIYRLQALLK